MKYVLITKRDCPFCISAVDLLKSKEVEHEVTDMQDTPEALTSVKNIFQWSTVPLVLLKRHGNHEDSDTYELIGGFDDLKEHLIRDVGVG